ncbi:MAG: 16S rRNA (cytosine(967)-C(5))-methyltransferase [Lentisphaerae bacterium RIFOXYC12_FULL_60_16]|nr:MAG: 16S rRNA (cytosine(967)-C(5))-methyltransferase [Lentisphaerae bacterium RIFOXYC12_FULL_60_16]OGV71957.1 MAG: 16S rRNA (cytosine(967)-C(5))-methyltransferase [Lentisphaerae bacterium RIFOXYA12_FULL_60_10]
MSPSTPPRHNARATAVSILGRWLQTGNFPDRLIAPGTPDRAFVTELVYGVIRWKRQLEWLVQTLARRNPENDVAVCLWVGLYQLLRMDHVADHAAVHETVELVKQGRHARAAGFVNHLLREAIRQRESLQASIQAQPLGIRESHPDDLIECWTRTMGADPAEALCRWNNTTPDVTIHPNPARVNLDLYRSTLLGLGIHAIPAPAAPLRCILLPHGISIPDLPGYREGWFSVQDPATFAAVDMLGAQPGETVLDACASPGGKTTLISESMNHTGTLVALERHADRIHRLRDTVERMQLSHVRIVQGDATHTAGSLAEYGPFDAILADVPCTNTGVIRRRPDARWRFNTERLNRRTSVQTSILNHLATLLKPNGRLVYSTCSLEPEENDILLQSWLTHHPTFRMVASARLLPQVSGTDGAYAALLIASGSAGKPPA